MLTVTVFTELCCVSVHQHTTIANGRVRYFTSTGPARPLSSRLRRAASHETVATGGIPDQDDV